MEALFDKFKELIIKCEIDYCDEFQEAFFEDEPSGYEIKSYNGFHSEDDYHYALRDLMYEIRQSIDKKGNEKYTDLLKLKSFILDLKGFISEPHFDGYMNNYSHKLIPSDFLKKAYLPWHLSVYLDKAYKVIMDLEEWALDTLALIKNLPKNEQASPSSMSTSKIDKLYSIVTKLIEKGIYICDATDSLILCEYLLKERSVKNPIYLKSDNRQFKAFYDFTKDYFPPVVKQKEIEHDSILYTENRKKLTSTALTEAGYNPKSKKSDKYVKPKNFDIIENTFKNC
jgi:hypothetical protein